MCLCKCFLIAGSHASRARGATEKLHAANEKKSATRRAAGRAVGLEAHRPVPLEHMPLSCSSSNHGDSHALCQPWCYSSGSGPDCSFCKCALCSECLHIDTPPPPAPPPAPVVLLPPSPAPPPAPPAIKVGDSCTSGQARDVHFAQCQVCAATRAIMYISTCSTHNSGPDLGPICDVLHAHKRLPPML